MSSHKPRILILTGPQGSGNHLFSKIFALHPRVFGWKQLNQTYWIGHHDEPFARYWLDPTRLGEHDWSSHEYHVTSVSCPFIYQNESRYPDFDAFIECVKTYAEPEIAVIGRDRNILDSQQRRVRGGVTMEVSRFAFDECIHLSTELLYLYRRDYLRQLSRLLAWPIDFESAEVDNILAEDPNRKYIQYVEHGPVDELVRKACLES